MPGCIPASSSTVRAPCFVVARTCDPGIGASSMSDGTGPRGMELSGHVALETA